MALSLERTRAVIERVRGKVLTKEDERTYDISDERAEDGDVGVIGVEPYSVDPEPDASTDGSDESA